MRLHLTADAAGIRIQLPASLIKGISDSHIYILMRVVLVRLPADHQLATWNGHVDPHMVKVTLVVMLMVCFHDDTATHYLAINLIQFFSLFPDPCFHCL